MAERRGVGRPRLWKIGIPRPAIDARVTEIRLVAGAIRSGKDVFGMNPEDALERVATSLEDMAKEEAKEKELVA